MGLQWIVGPSICILFQTKMEVSVKYQITNQSTINAMTFHPQLDLLTTAATNSDTCSFFTPSQDLQLQPKFMNESKPPGQISCLAWSPNGQMLALGHTKVEVWKFANLRFCPLATFNEDFVQVKNISWSPDSARYICNGISKSLAVHVRNVQTNQLQVLAFDVLVVSSLFDQFGKYIAILSSDNKIHIYDSNTLSPLKTISMAFNSKDFHCLKDHKILSWSPDFTLLASPNLNDVKISTAVIFDRTKNFNVKNILIGHKTPINCMKFNPNIYQTEGEKTYILAVGDSSGTLSIWKIGGNQNQPLLLTSSPLVADESIEQIFWDKEGKRLFLHVMKKYVVMYDFISQFGQPVSQIQKANHIQRIFGVTGVKQITGESLEVFGMNQMDIKKQKQTLPKFDDKFTTSDLKSTQITKEYIKTPQQVIENGNKKKRIIPSRIIEKKNLMEEEEKCKEKIVEREGPKINIKPIKWIQRNTLYLDEENYLEIKYFGEILKLKIASKMANEEEICIEKNFSGVTSHIKIIYQRILVVNQNSLHIYDYGLHPLDLPIFIGEIVDFTANDDGDVYFMLSNGKIRGFNFIKRQFLAQTSINLILKSSEEEIVENPLMSFIVHCNDQHKIHIQLKQNHEKYFFDPLLNSWIQLNFDTGYFMQGHSLKISKRQKLETDNFFESLKNPTKLPNNSSTIEYQLQLLYYKKFCQSREMYSETLMKMFCDLRNSGNDRELRRQIQEHFFDEKSPKFSNNHQLWQEVKKIGGSVIQQFILMEKHNEN